MTEFTHTEKRVIYAMFELSRPATRNEIAQWADNMSWNTADKVLRDLEERGIVGTIEDGNRIYWGLIEFE